MADAALFEAEFAQPDIPADPRIPALIWWAARFAELGWTPSYGPGDHGNLSCRTSTGLLVSARQTQKARLEPEHFVEVIGIDWERLPGAWWQGRTFQCRGRRLPSTDTLMHARIYAQRPDCQAILHAHDAASLAHAATLRLPITRVSAKQPSMELVEEVCALAREHDYLLTRDHGFLALGRTIDQAGELTRTVSARARTLVAAAGPAPGG